MKACVECKHFGGPEAEVYTGGLPPSRTNGPECKHPDAASRDMIYGKAFCQAERNTNKGCGRTGKLWVKRP